jgi:alpha-ketoglutarate-dependent taurine dioxygenase
VPQLMNLSGSALAALPTGSRITRQARNALLTRGWALLRASSQAGSSMEAQCLTLARQLGVPTPSRSKGVVDVLVPTAHSGAKPQSLSRRVGLGEQPWHVDLAYRMQPARYLVVGCLSSGQTQVRTELVDREAFLPRSRLLDALAEPYLVRNGGKSFYATILEGSEEFIRFDPGCMYGCTQRARLLMQGLLTASTPPTYTHSWASGDILIVNNWRMLHRRADASHCKGRALLRVSVCEEFDV